MTQSFYLVQSQCPELKATEHASLSLIPQNMGMAPASSPELKKQSMTTNAIH